MVALDKVRVHGPSVWSTFHQNMTAWIMPLLVRYRSCSGWLCSCSRPFKQSEKELNVDP
jgi:hypothetical protein